MKRKLILSCSIALAMTTVMAVVNLILGSLFDVIIGKTYIGGEVTVSYGFGIKLIRFYPMTTIDSPIQNSTSLQLAAGDFLITAGVLAIICFVIYSIAEMITSCIKKAKIK